MSRTLDLFGQQNSIFSDYPELSWPKIERFPLNLEGQDVADAVVNDLRRSSEALIITGYAALDQLIDFAAGCPDETRIRILFGQEPFPSRRETFELEDRRFPREMEAYWLEQQISVLLSAKVILCIERLESGQIDTRYLGGNERLHAKIYCGDDAATLGSSNFTRPGLHTQHEANARFTAVREEKRFQELKSIAENYWRLGRDYNKELIKLLRQLLRMVPWREALARACAELLEGKWAEKYLKGTYLPHEAKMWPSQRQGIAQALAILSNHDSVLIADATGSGKTRMGIHLIGALIDHNLRSGRMRQGKALMVCPPTVKKAWDWEATWGGVSLESYSHGSLSHAKSQQHDISVENLRRAQILCVDEGHNFVNFKSNRTQRLLRNMADHMLLFTATPINRSVTDLLRLADLLGADNLKPSTLKAFQKMLGVRNLNRTLTEPEITLLRQEIRRFTVRRTKRMLNRLIERDPKHYTDKDGNPCRFPRHHPRTYRLREPESDRALAAQIRLLADQLLGVAHFEKPIEMPEVLRQQQVREEEYLKGRLASATKLARYVIMASLRSSRAALVEHAAGTRQAIKDFKLEGFRKSSPLEGVIRRFDKLAGHPPENRLSIHLPGWLTDPDKHAEACRQDKQIYQEIHRLALQMSDHREACKVNRLVSLLKRHSLLLAFDNRPITLEYLARRIRKVDKDARVLVATGDPSSDRTETLTAFELGSKEELVIGLCSDSLSEGVNLQQASALMHLDMPSVVRIAEQRAGRVDRMDSPHTTIEAWWPEDAPEFALASDERFIERYETVDNLLGSNMPLPEALQERSAKPVKAQDIIQEYEQGDALWDGIHDAFEAVRTLVEGRHPLIDKTVYERYCGVTATVLSRVSLVRSGKPWAFFCIRAGAMATPRWIFLPGFTGSPVTELESIADALREHLGDEIEDLEMNEQASRFLDTFIRRLNEVERSLLSNKKQRALDEMEKVLERYIKDAAKRTEQQSVDQYQKLLDVLRYSPLNDQPDWDEIATRWLDLIRPVWYERLTAKGRTKPLLLRDIRRDLYGKEATLGQQIVKTFGSFPTLDSPDKRIAACIIGIS